MFARHKRHPFEWHPSFLSRPCLVTSVLPGAWADQTCWRAQLQFLCCIAALIPISNGSRGMHIVWNQAWNRMSNASPQVHKSGTNRCQAWRCCVVSLQQAIMLAQSKVCNKSGNQAGEGITACRWYRLRNAFGYPCIGNCRICVFAVMMIAC